MLTDTTREEWMRGWSEGAFDVTVGILGRNAALMYLEGALLLIGADMGAREFGYVAALSAALGVI